MSRFNPGDRVRRENSDGVGYVRIGTVMGLIPNEHGLDIFQEYEVEFGANGILIAYESQLEPASPSQDDSRHTAVSS